MDKEEYRLEKLSGTLKRSVICALCKEPLYYSSHIKYEPEVMIDYFYSQTGKEIREYAHEKCWNKFWLKF